MLIFKEWELHKVDMIKSNLKIQTNNKPRARVSIILLITVKNGTFILENDHSAQNIYVHWIHTKTLPYLIGLLNFLQHNSLQVETILLAILKNSQVWVNAVYSGYTRIKPVITPGRPFVSPKLDLHPLKVCVTLLNTHLISEIGKSSLRRLYFRFGVTLFSRANRYYIYPQSCIF